MRPPKEIWTNNYNEYILDLYDANPMVQKPNGTTKKAPEPDKNPRKTQASPKESFGDLTTIVNESLRLRNTAVLNVKLAEQIFRWEKERLAKIKPFPDPKDDDDEGGEIIIEDIDKDDFKFPKFPKFKLPKPPKPKTKPKTKPDPGPVRTPRWEFPKIPVIPFPLPRLPNLDGVMGFAARPAFTAPALVTYKELAKNNSVFYRTFVRPDYVGTDSARQVETQTEVEVESDGSDTRSRSRSGGRRVSDREVRGDADGGGGRSTTATMEKPRAGGGGSGGNNPKKVIRGKRGNIFFGEDNDSAFNRQFLNQNIEDLQKALNDRVSKRIRTNPLSPPTAEEQLLKDAINMKKMMDRMLNSGAISRKNDLSWMNETPEKPTKKIQKRLPGTNPNTIPRISSSLTSGKKIQKRLPTPNSPLDLLLYQTIAVSAADMKALSGNRNLSNIPDPITGELPTDKIFRQNLTRRGRLKAGGLALTGLDIGLTALDFMDRKAGGQSDLQAPVGAGSSFVWRPIFGGVAASKTATALSPLLFTPVPGSRVLYGAAVFLAGLIGGTIGSYGTGTVADMITGADGVPDFRKAAPKLNDVNAVRNFLNPLKLTDKGFVVDPTKKAPTIDTGYVTGPSNKIGGSSDYHIDAKFSKSMSNDQMIDMMDMIAIGYLREGREIEFSNKGVAGFHWNIGLSRDQKLDLIKRVRNAHRPTNGFYSIDYYTPMVGTNRFDKKNSKVEGAPILAPRIEGTTIQRYTGEGDPKDDDGYGKFLHIVDEEGNIIMKMGHGDIDVGPSGGTIKIKKPQEVSSRVLNTDEDGKDEEDAMMMLNSMNFGNGTLIGSQPDIIPLPIQMPQLGSSAADKINYSTWGHPIKAG